MKPSERCVNVVKMFESFRARPYKDCGGLWTVGYGELLPKNIPMSEIKNMTITQEEGEARLRKTLDDIGKQINSVLKVNVSQEMFDALCSFVYNVGFGAFRSSTMLKLINEGKFELAADEFLKWVYVGNKKIAGLVARRTSERNLFLQGVQKIKMHQNLS